MSRSWRIELLGGLRACAGDLVVTRFRTRKTAALLAWLAVRPGRRHPRETLTEKFWPGAEPHASRNSLSQALSSLRRSLEAKGPKLIGANRNEVWLEPDGFTTDVAELQQLLKQARHREGADAEPLLRQAVELYRGAFLPGFYLDWVLRERRALCDAAVRALRRLARLCFERGERTAALEYARRAVDLEPISEESHCLLMQLLAASGEVAAARRQFEELERILEEELDVSPAMASYDLLVELEDLSVQPPPLPPAAPTGTLTLLGLALDEPATEGEIGGFLVSASNGERVVAYDRATGALEEAAALLTARAGAGRVVADTGEVDGPIDESSAAARLRSLRRAVRAGQILCTGRTALLAEIEAASGLELVDVGPWLLDGAERPERLYRLDYPAMPVGGRLAPKAIPGGPAALRARSERQDELERFIRGDGDGTRREVLDEGAEARRLADWLQRAKEIREGWRGPEQVALLSQLAAEAEDLDATLTWAGRNPAHAVEGLRLVTTLWRFWLLRGHLSEGRELLDRMLRLSREAEHPLDHGLVADALRASASLALAQGDLEAARARFQESMAGARAAGSTDGSRTVRALNGLALVAKEAGDLDDAIRILDEAEAALQDLEPDGWLEAQTANNQGLVAILRGDLEAARPRLEIARQRYTASGDLQALTRVMNNLGVVALSLQDLDEAERLFSAAAQQAEQLGDRNGQGQALNNLGNVAFCRGDHATARDRYRERLALTRSMGDSGGIIQALNNLGFAQQQLEQFDEAHRLHEQALAWAREAGNRRGEALALEGLALVARTRGEPSVARNLFEENLAIMKELGDRGRIVTVLEDLARLAGDRDDAAGAVRLWSAASSLREQLGRPASSSASVALEQARAVLGDEAYEAEWQSGQVDDFRAAVAVALEDGSAPT